MCLFPTTEITTVNFSKTSDNMLKNRPAKGNYLCTVLTQTLRASRNWKLWKLVTDGSAAGLCYTRATGAKETCG